MILFEVLKIITLYILVLLDEHIQSTHNGLQDITKSIMVVADSINNLAAAVRESKI